MSETNAIIIITIIIHTTITTVILMIVTARSSVGSNRERDKEESCHLASFWLHEKPPHQELQR